MKPISPIFNHDDLIQEVTNALKKGLKLYQIPEQQRCEFTNVDCLLSGLALFTFKYPSLLQFDHQLKQNQTLLANLKTLFKLHDVPSDTQMRTRLDELLPEITRPAFTRIFQLLQRSKVLEQFRFFNNKYLLSLDGTGIFASSAVHCQNCCSKNHRDGTTSYYHQTLAAALVHPDQKVVFPFALEPIQKGDGDQKNDCERNAAKRWVKEFRKEHPHLKVILLADGLSSNEPFIALLREHHLNFILVCKESDHQYLTDWVNHLDPQDKVTLKTNEDGIDRVYDYMEQVPLNDAKQQCLVNVVRFQETIKGQPSKWMWVTDLWLKQKDLPLFVRGARARWKIENETFNTLKNQGYAFEHNFGHGKKNLHTVFSLLMMLAIFN